MRWRKRDLWKAAIVGGGVLFLVLMTLVTVSVADAHGSVSGAAIPTPTTVSATPTVDPTMVALQKEQLQHENDWWWSNGATILSSFLSTLVIVVGALIGFWQWRMNRNDTRTKESNDRKEAQERDLRDREAEREKETAAQHKELRDRAEERFKTAVTALGSDNEGTQVGGAILLRSFLNKEDKEIYGRYYTQIFDLAVAYLRLSTKSHPSSDNTPMSLTSFRHAIVVILRESYLLVRDTLMGQKESKYRLS